MQIGEIIMELKSEENVNVEYETKEEQEVIISQNVANNYSM